MGTDKNRKRGKRFTIFEIAQVDKSSRDGKPK